MTEVRNVTRGWSEEGKRGEPVAVVQVETDESVAERTASALRAAMEDVAVETVADADGAFERIAEGGVACLVTADHLPDTDATALLQSIREEHPDLPVVVFTDRDAHEVARRVFSTDLTGYVDRSDPDAHAAVAERVRDLVSRSRERRRLRRVEDRYRKLLERSPTPIGIVDADGRFVYANEPAADLLDADDPADLRGRSVQTVVPDTHRRECAALVERILRRREATEPREVAIESLDGQRKHAVWAGVPVGYQGELAAQFMLNDITAHKRLQRRLRRQRDRFNVLFGELPEPVVEVRFEEGRPHVERVNDAFEETFGVDCAGDEPTAILGSDGEAADLAERAREGERVELEVTRDTVDGERDFLLRVVTFTVDGDAWCYVIYVDISELIARERELQRQNERLEEFASVLSHDLRNPLMVAQATVEMADIDEEHADRLDRAHDRMERLIEDVLTLAREGEIRETQAVSVATIAERARETTGTDGATVDIDTDATIDADPSALREVFENLFRNAVEHGAPDDGEVSVRVTDLPDGFAVEDDGVGIPAEDRETVFESGYSTVQHNTGFGLRIVRQLVAAHGWQLDLTESDDGGARFEMTGVETYD